MTAADPTTRLEARRAPPDRDGPGGRSRPPWGRPAVALAVLAALGGLSWGVTRLASGGAGPAPLPTCTVATAAGRFSTDVTQGANAASIAAIGRRLGLPDHAVTIALATALQESKLRNLGGGDRDSVGLFQQRPSEGWGTRTELLDPTYATTAFYRALERVPGWETLSVADAAQAVQHSAAPDAYALQEAAGRSLAVALTGEDAAAFSCHYRGAGGAVDPAWRAALAGDLGAGDLPGRSVSTSTGWAMAGWLVAHAQRYRLHTVSFGGLTWRPGGTGAWSKGGSDVTVQVT